jgi:hypothetical protein
MLALGQENPCLPAVVLTPARPWREPLSRPMMVNDHHIEVRDDRAADLRTEGTNVSTMHRHIAVTVADACVGDLRRAASPGAANPPPLPACRPSTLAAP